MKSEKDTKDEILPRKLTPEMLKLDVSDANFHVLRKVSLESIWGLLERCPLKHLKPGESLLTLGEPNQTMYLVLSGKLGVHLEKVYAPPVAYLVAGQTVGEMSVIDDRPASAHVVATEESSLLVVDKETFWRLVYSSHELSVNLLVLLAQRVRTNNFSLRESAKLQQQFEHEAMTDGLTGLYNKRWLMEKLSRIIGRYQRSRSPISILMIDVDHFKKFNDTLGHAAGDLALRTVAQGISKNLRPLDLGARFGGEEFVVILPDTDAEGARVAANRLREAISKTAIKSSDEKVYPSVTISVGLAQLKGNEGADAILERADRALYLAKKNGRNRVEG